jgi:hypothetical protein
MLFSAHWIPHGIVLGILDMIDLEPGWLRIERREELLGEAEFRHCRDLESISRFQDVTSSLEIHEDCVTWQKWNEMSEYAVCFDIFKLTPIRPSPFDSAGRGGIFQILEAHSRSQETSVSNCLAH